MAKNKPSVRSASHTKKQGRAAARRETRAAPVAVAEPPAPSVQPAAHLINLRDGVLSHSGVLSTSEADLAALFQHHLPAALAQATGPRPLRIVFFAHGGLTDEKSAMETALRRIPWWLANGVYPIFFIWETGLEETLRQMIDRKISELWGSLTAIFSGRRGLFDFLPSWDTDPAVELAARTVGGVAIWGAMKDSAQRAGAPQTGGAWKAAQLLAGFLHAHQDADIEVHAIGHSAGSIFHAHFLEALHQAGGSVKSLHHLAPAARVDLFKEKVLPLIGHGIDQLTLYTMTDEKEQEDTCTNVYQKSLLYLIFHGLEPEKQCPILGLQRSIQADADLMRLFTPGRPAEIIWSPSNAGPRSASACLSHGGFADDDATMNSVCRRIVNRDAIVEFATSRAVAPVLPAFGPSDDQIILGILTERAIKLANGTATEPAAAAVGTPPPRGTPPAAGGARLALCIGIDDYPNPGDQLGGCVNDARNWHALFSQQGFQSRLMLNADATWDNMRAALKEFVRNAQAGDVIAVQYSGHGTHVKDLDGDEDDDGQDEAICCYDFRLGKLLLDDDIGALMRDLRPGVNFSLFMDCCHSGSNTRVAANFDQPLPAGTRARLARPSEELNAAHAEFRKKMGSSKPRGTRSGNPYEGASEILFAAALPQQLANEVSGAGVFTTAALPLLKSGAAFTNDSFIAAVKRAFPAAFQPVQEPKLFCATAAAPRALLQPLA